NLGFANHPSRFGPTVQSGVFKLGETPTGSLYFGLLNLRPKSFKVGLEQLREPIVSCQNVDELPAQSSGVPQPCHHWHRACNRAASQKAECFHKSSRAAGKSSGDSNRENKRLAGCHGADRRSHQNPTRFRHSCVEWL